MRNESIVSGNVERIERLAYNARDTRIALGGISNVTLWRLEKAGYIHRVPGIRHRLYARAELERFLSGGGAAQAS